MAAALLSQAVLTHFTVRHLRRHLHVIRTLRDRSGSGRARAVALAHDALASIAAFGSAQPRLT